MDKNTFIGFLLIALIIIGFAVINKPSEEQIARQRRYNDSIAQVQQARAASEAAMREAAAALETQNQELDPAALQAKLADAFGAFGPAASGEDEFYTLENERLRVVLSSKGGRVHSAELKEYRTHDSLPLFLFDGKESMMNFTLVTNNNRIVNTKDLYFRPMSGVKTDEEGNQSFVLRLNTADADAYIDFFYTLPADDYMLGFNIIPHNISRVMPAGTNSLEMQWTSKLRQQEKGRKFEDRYAALNYRFASENDVEMLNAAKNDSQRLNNRVKWIAFKDQFFSSILIADDAIISANLSSRVEPEHSGYLKDYAADMVVPFDALNGEPTSFKLYLGPNHHKTLASYDKGVEAPYKLYLRKIIPLGWFGFVNRWFIIPMFNFFRGFIGNMGIIILLMTLVVKVVIFPMTYKSYMSSAKMRVLKPEIDEIYARIPEDKPVERQQATMKLYNKVGVSPMSGCLPLLLQMPILIAMFGFFPTAIELRQESFLWAKDLSAYDAIISWNAHIPIISSIFDNHISLFCLLMTITTFLSNKLNSATQAAAAGGDQMKMMQWMMNLMPLMFFFIFNNYASGLTYYYFLSTLISVAQTYIIRATVNEEKLLAQLRAKGNAKNANPKKKSSFMERLEKMQREQQKAMQQQSRRR